MRNTDSYGGQRGHRPRPMALSRPVARRHKILEWLAICLLAVAIAFLLAKGI